MNDNCLQINADYALEFVNYISSLERVLRGTGEPVEILEAMLLAVRHFYQADSVSLVETNMHCLSQWRIMRVDSADDIPVQSSKRLPDISKETMPNLYQTLMQHETIAIHPATDSLTETELQMLGNSNIDYAVIAPFQKRRSGYLLLRNPHRWVGHNEFVQIASYVIVSELNEVNLINELDLVNKESSPMGEFDIHVTAFGSLNITTSIGTLSDVKVNNLAMRLVIYLVLNRHRLVPQEELISALWGSDLESGNTNNLRQQIMRARQEIGKIYPKDFIVIDYNNRYRLSPDVKIHLDTDAFEAYYAKGRYADFADTRISYFMEAIRLYNGPLLADNKKDEWIERTRTYYHMEIVSLIMDLLPVLLEKEDYENLYLVACRGIDIEPARPSFHYYYLLSLYHKGFYDQARKHLFQHNDILSPQDRSSIIFLLSNVKM